MTQSRKTYRISYAGSGALCVRMHDRAALPLHSAMDRTAVFFSAYDGGKQCIGKRARGALRGTLEEENIIMTKRQLALAVAIAAIGTNAVWMNGVSAAEKQDVHGGGTDAVDTYELDPVDVEGERSEEANSLTSSTGGTGFLGTKDVMEVPFTQTNITNKALTQYGDAVEPLTSALLMSPSVRTSSSTMYNDFSMRGFPMNAYQFKVNGVPGMFSQTNMPSNFVERMEVISGPAIGVHGSTNSESAGGSVNLVTKRAAYGKERITYTQTVSTGGALGEIVDIGRRFGRNEAWGLRINAENIQGKTAVEREKLTTRDFYINLDHAGSRSTTNLFMGYRYTKDEGGQRYFDFSGTGANLYTGSRLPSAPSGKRNYSFPGQHIEVKTWTAVLNHEQQLSDTWKAFFNAGYSRNYGSSYVMTSSSKLFMRNEAGDFYNTLWTYPYGLRNAYTQLGVRGTFHIGDVKNDVVLALDRDWYHAYWGYERNGAYGNAVPSFGNMSGSLSGGVRSVTWNYMPSSVRGAIKSGVTTYSGVSLTDTIEYGKATALLGIHHHSVKATSYAAGSGYNRARSTTVSSSANSPTFGIVYRPTDDLSIYANHSESFDKGNVVGSGFMNTGVMLSPAKTKQNEIGVKYRRRGVLAGLSVFQIEQDRTIDVRYTGDPNPSRVMEGKINFKGVELSVSGQIAPKWTLTGGLMHLTTEQQTNTGYNGKAVAGVADWSGMLAVEYAPDTQFTAFARAIYSGSAPIYTGDARKLNVPSYLTCDLGVTYKTKFGTVPAAVSLTAYNLFDKRYWMSRPTYNFGIQGYPRSLVLSMTMDI